MRQPRNCRFDTCCRLVRREADRGFFFWRRRQDAHCCADVACSLFRMHGDSDVLRDEQSFRHSSFCADERLRDYRKGKVGAAMTILHHSYSTNGVRPSGSSFPESKFIHPDGREAVYDGKTCELICDDDYAGTYNYVNSSVKGDGLWSHMWRSVGHFFSDMLPYYIWGN